MADSTDPGDRYLVELFAEQSAIAKDDVVAFWIREEATPVEEAERRADEIHLVATTGDGELVAVSTAYLRVNPQLRMPLWHYRAFVARAHRMTTIAARISMIGRDHLQERFVDGVDRRCGGIVYEVENKPMRTHLNQAVWPRSDVTFVGINKRGAHTRVRYFPGALAPEQPDELRPGI